MGRQVAKMVGIGLTALLLTPFMAIGNAAAATPGQGYASVTLDDGWADQYDNARPILSERGIPATFYLISGTFGWDEYMTADQARQLSADGFEIGNHTVDHADLATLGSLQIRNEFVDAQAGITEATGVTPTTCAYPYGSYNQAVQDAAAEDFSVCRTTDDGVNDPTNLNRYGLAVYNVFSDTTAGQVRAAAEQAKADGTWVIFVYHRVGAVSDIYDTTTEAFTAQMDALKDSGITLQTVGQMAAY